MVAFAKPHLKPLTPDRSAMDSGLRFYSPEISRWLNRDPIGENGGVNLYGFIGNEAMGRSDLLGLGSWHECQTSAVMEVFLLSTETAPLAKASFSVTVILDPDRCACVCEWPKFKQDASVLEVRTSEWSDDEGGIYMHAHEWQVDHPGGAEYYPESEFAPPRQFRNTMDDEPGEMLPLGPAMGILGFQVNLHVQAVCTEGTRAGSVIMGALYGADFKRYWPPWSDVRIRPYGMVND